MEKKYEQSLYDAEMQKKWAEENIYTCNSDSSKELFSIDTPPPTVSGSLHIGHVFSYTQTDIIARFKRLSGYNVFYPFGFDNNGLPTERFVEKKHKVSGYHMKRSDFIELCAKESSFVEKEFEKLWQRLGISADWKNTYSTISSKVRALSQRSFLDLLKKGYVYRKEEPALYCTTCFTSVAQAELDDVETPSYFNDIEFKTTDGKPLLIATTRPELLPSCVALFFNPDDARYKDLLSTKAVVPLFNYEVPILADELVDPEKGTGLVMCCTFGDKNDIAWYKKHNLSYRQSVGFDGKWAAQTGELRGLKVIEARAKIIAMLKAENVLIHQKPITHPVNVHERCQKPIEYVVLKQWFLHILKYKNDFLQIADKIDWHPHFMKSRYKDWVEHLQWDWCLSRQRFYGIPFPIWHCNDCKEILIPTDDTLPLDPQETMFPAKTCPQCQSANISADTDVMDTWNTSSITPYICAEIFTQKPIEDFSYNLNTFLPMSMRPQAHDIIRTWAFYTIIKTWMHHRTMPWKEIVISGHVLSNEKNKISKSKGNNPTDPEVLLQNYPADAIRYWTASGTLGHDIAFSEGQLQIGLKLQTKLWNAFRFIYEHINNLETITQPQHLGTINEWLCHQVHQAFMHYQQELKKHEFAGALAAAERFFWQDFCDNYIEIIKDQLFKPENYQPQEVEATRWTLHHVGLRILQMFAPYLPHVTEKLYTTLYQKHLAILSLHITHFNDIQTVHNYPSSVETAKLLMTIIGKVRRLKTEKQLSLKTPLSSLALYGINQELLKMIISHEQLIKGVTQAQVVVYDSGSVPTERLEQHHEAWSGIIDMKISE